MVPVSQMWTVASYAIGKRLRGVEKYPLVLMLEPLMRCNLACAGCGKIQYPGHVLRKQLSPSKNVARRWSACPAASRSCTRRSMRSSRA